MIKLNFKVDSKYLENNTVVDDPISILITKPDDPAFDPLLGESGRAMARDGATFIFNRALGEFLIDKGVAKEL